MNDQPSLELIVYKLTQLETSLERYHAEVEQRFDRSNAERSALAARVAALESWKVERNTLLSLEANARANRDRLLWGLLSSMILLVLKDLWPLFRA